MWAWPSVHLALFCGDLGDLGPAGSAVGSLFKDRGERQIRAIREAERLRIKGTKTERGRHRERQEGPTKDRRGIERDRGTHKRIGEG